MEYLPLAHRILPAIVETAEVLTEACDMARYEFKLPDIGEGVTEGEIVSWLVEPGDAVAEDQPMVEVMTDKATVTITAPQGRPDPRDARRRWARSVQVHSVLVVFDLDGARGRRVAGASSGRGSVSRAKRGARSREPPRPPRSATSARDLPGMHLAASARRRARRHRGARQAATSTKSRSRRRDAQARARSRARPAAVPPTGPGGRVTSDDVARSAEAAAERASRRRRRLADAAARRRAARGRPPAQASGSRASAACGPPSGAARGAHPAARLRKRIFENMARSKHTAAHFTFVEECDVTALKDLRERLKPAAPRRRASSSTFLPFIVKAVVAALEEAPDA